MFLSLVRPERISSPMTRSAAVTTCRGPSPSAILLTSGTSPCTFSIAFFDAESAPCDRNARLEPAQRPGRLHNRESARFRVPSDQFMRPDLIARYADERLPRYTSYPTAPHFT